MTRAARSIFVFGIYSVVTGLILVVVPNTLLSLLATGDYHGALDPRAWHRGCRNGILLYRGRAL